MNRNESNQIEKLLAQVQLRRPELDVETLLRRATEPEGSVTRREQIAHTRRKHSFCRWATLTGVWTSGLAVGVLVSYLYVSNTVLATRAEFKALTQELKQQMAQAATASSQEKPAALPRPVTSPLHPKASSPRNNESLRQYDFLAHLDRPCSNDSTHLLRAGRHLFPDKPCSPPTPHRTSGHIPDAEPSTPIETTPYKPEPPKTQHQLFEEVLKDLNA